MLLCFHGTTISNVFGQITTIPDNCLVLIFHSNFLLALILLSFLFNIVVLYFHVCCQSIVKGPYSDMWTRPYVVLHTGRKTYSRAAPAHWTVLFFKRVAEFFKRVGIELYSRVHTLYTCWVQNWIWAFPMKNVRNNKSDMNYEKSLWKNMTGPDSWSINFL